jgi:hypothetical protein
LSLWPFLPAQDTIDDWAEAVFLQAIRMIDATRGVSAAAMRQHDHNRMVPPDGRAS